MKSITFDGRIGTGAEIRSTNGGKPYVRFSVANNSFVNSQEKTEWFEVTSYDPYVIENRVKVLTKGTYVIVQGQLNTDVKVKDGKVWINQYVTATSIEVPYFGKKNEDEQNVQEIKESISSQEDDPPVSTYTKPAAKSQPKPQPQTVAESAPEDEDLPF